METSRAEERACAHCGAPCRATTEPAFCCGGCETVFAILSGEGLERYYDLRPRDGLPARPDIARDHKWLEQLEAQIRDASGLTQLTVDVQGVHCAACVWLIDELFDRQGGGAACVVNPVRGRIHLTVEPGFDLEAWARSIESVGYALGPPTEGDAGVDALTIRMGISLALAGSAMMLSLAIYFGLADGALYTTSRQLVFTLAAATVLVGGSFFVRSAWRSLRRGALHLDLPIALGIVLAFAGSAWSFFAGDARGEFFDTVAVFIALMLVGRWLQERVVARNRARLLSSTGAEGVFTRRLNGGRAELIRCDELNAGDTLLLARGDLIPVNATLEANASLRLDWINGESEPRGYRAGQLAPAGAFLVSGRAVRARADTGFVDSPLGELLSAPASDPARGVFWSRLGRYYVLGVVSLAAGAFLLWSSDLQAALRVTTSVLVVTCPCAFGIAVPLAYELVHTASARRGLFVRVPSLMDRANDVRRLVFDKTGTLTAGNPQLCDAAPIDALAPLERAALYDLSARSTHPKSRAIADALPDGVMRPEFVAHEEPGCGMQAQHDGTLYRLGRSSWAAPEHLAEAGLASADLVFAANGRPLAVLKTQESLRPHAVEEIRALEAMGYEIWILSGDGREKVASLARALGIPRERALAERSPEGKARWLREHGGERDTLFVGDGINDTLAASAALVSGTPSIERPFMPARCDFYFMTAGLAPIRAMLEDARRLRRVVKADLALALAYNVGAVGLAIAGLIEPWMAAVLMPLSSIATIALTTVWLRRERPRRRPWTC